MKKQGKLVQWHIYQQTTHAWGNGTTIKHVFQLRSGEAMVYRYNATVSQDATRRSG